MGYEGRYGEHPSKDSTDLKEGATYLLDNWLCYRKEISLGAVKHKTHARTPFPRASYLLMDIVTR